MPILYVHGVGVRDKGESGWDAVQPFLGGLDWPDVEGKLRRYVAPALSSQPAGVQIEQVFWGDLGAAPLLPPLEQSSAAPPATLNRADLTDALEERLRQGLPPQLWPLAIEVAAATARNLTLRPNWEKLAPDAAWAALHRSAENQMRRRWAAQHPLEPWPLLSALREDVRLRLLQRVTHLRGPLEGFLPYFMGDVMGYPLRRGVPADPGPIPQRVLAGLRRMQQVKAQTGESIVVLTHSMGGQLMYDALSAYAPASADLQGLKVDFWAAAASQLGLFASLNLFAQTTDQQGILPPLHNLGYLWNIWSPADFLSFQGNGAIPEAHDIAINLTDDVFKAHMAYITTPLFYQMLASKVSAVCGREAAS